MKSLKLSFHHLFIDGEASQIETARVFLSLAIPVILGVLVYCLINHIK